MSGLEKMKSRILDEANQSAEKKLAEAERRAEEILERAKAEAEEEASRITQKAERDAAVYKERIESACEMQYKKAMLQTKQEIISDVLEKAYETILNLDDESYFSMIKELLAQYVQPREGTIYFSASDLKRMPEGFAESIKKTAEEKGGALALSGDVEVTGGGFILAYGGIEENCTIRAMLHARKEELSDSIHNALFVS